MSSGRCRPLGVVHSDATQPISVVLGEPTNHLDIRHQIELLELIKRLKTTLPHCMT
jgi:iron complex transport system ATP-binding protein